MIRKQKQLKYFAIAIMAIMLIFGMAGNAAALLDKDKDPKYGEALKTVKEGKTLYVQGQFDKARKKCNEALKIDKEFPPALALLAEIITAEKGFSMTLEDYTEAYRLARKALLLDEELVDGYRAMAELERMRGNILPSIKLATIAVNMSPEDPMNHFTLASAYLRGDPNKSAEHFEKALELGSTDPRIQFNLGVLYIAVGKYKEAEKSTLEYLKLKPDDYRAYHNLGHIYFSQGDMEKAFESYNKVIAQKPDFAASLKGLGDVMMQKKDYGKAVEFYDRACQADQRDPTFFYLKGEALEMSGKIEDAKAAYMQTLAIDPGFVSARQKLQNLEKAP